MYTNKNINFIRILYKYVLYIDVVKLVKFNEFFQQTIEN